MDFCDDSNLERDEFYMWRCIELAKRGRANVGTNPMVGCVIVCEDMVIGEGYHRKFGEPHAEVNAIRSIKPEDEKLIQLSTLYVNLEPCAHFGKTPPCALMIVHKNFKRVVVGMSDPYCEVDGRGIKDIRDAGISVTVGVLEDKCRHLNRRTSLFHSKKRPYIILKWAQSLDGYMDINRTPEEPAPWLTNERCRMLVHKWRTEERAIMVGSNTVKRDDPLLTARNWYGQNPLRITIDRRHMLPKMHHIFNNDASTLVFCNSRSQTRAFNKTRYIPMDFNSPRWTEIITDYLHELGITSLIIEGGAYILNQFIERNLYDESRVFYSPRYINECSKTGGGVMAPMLSKGVDYKHSIIDGVLVKTTLHNYYE